MEMKKIKKIWFLISILIIAALVLAACGCQTDTTSEAPTAVPEKGEEPAPPGEQERDEEPA